MDRVQELNSFFQYLLRFPEIFTVEPVEKFFDSKLNSADLQSYLSKIERPPVETLLQMYQVIFPESAEKRISMEARSNLIKFKEKIDINVEFFLRFRDVCDDLRGKTASNFANIRDEFKAFNEMIMITFSSDKEK